MNLVLRKHNWKYIIWTFLCLQCINCQDSISALIGEKTKIPCNITPSVERDTMTLVLWYKDDSEAPLYGLDSRSDNGSLEPEHFISDKISGRGYFNIASDPAGLEINGLFPNDTGLYKCRVDFHKSRTVKQDTFLQVIIPPRKPVIENLQGHTLYGVIGPYNEGDILVLVCKGNSGSPQSKLKWWRGASLLQTETEEYPNGVTISVLTIEHLSRDYLKDDLVCEANNNNLTQPPSTKVTIDLNFKPESVEISSIRKPLSSRKQAKLICQSGGSKPPAAITWFLGNKQLDSTEEIISDVKTTSILTYTPSSLDHGKQLSCKANNPLIPDSEIEDRWKLAIYFPPEPSLSLKDGTDSEMIKENENIELFCNIRANPPVTELQWMLNGNLLSEDPSGVEINDHRLKLSRVNKSQSGTYKCSARNREGMVQSNDFSLDIKYAPICKSTRRNYGVSRDEAARIQCNVEADPPDVSFQWKFNNTFKELKVDSYIVSNASSTVTYVPTGSDDFGHLFCWARNSIGLQQVPCIFKIFIAEPPRSVYNCNVVNRSSSSFNILCSAGNDGGLDQRFIIEVYDKRSYTLRSNMTSESQPNFSVRYLPADTDFLIIIYAANAKGRSHSVTLVSKTLPSDSRQGGSSVKSGLSLILIILLGLVLFLIILALVVTIRLKAWRRKKRSKRKKAPSNSESSSSAQVSPKEVTKEIEYDFYEIKNPDIIPSRNSASDSGYSEYYLEELPVKKPNNIREETAQNPVADAESRFRKHKNNLKYHEPKLKPHIEEETDHLPDPGIQVNISPSRISTKQQIVRQDRSAACQYKRENNGGITLVTPLLETLRAESEV